MSKKEVIIGDNGSEFVAKLKSNFDELYMGSGGIGYIIQSADNISSESWWNTQAATYNTFSITSDYDFEGANITLPAGITLLFNGGVWSNGTVNGVNTNFLSFGIQKCFEPSLILGGQWLIPYLTPQHYGAVANENNTTFENDAHDAIQACFNSTFDVFIPAGFYYVASQLLMPYEKTIYCNEGIAGGSPSQAVIYTNQNINLLIIRDTVRWRGGVLDVSQVAAYTANALIMDVNYPLVNGEIDIRIVGSRTGLLAGTNTGKGLYINYDQNATHTGYLHRFKFNVKISSLYYGLYFPAKGDPAYATWINVLELNIDTYGCKRPIYVGTDSWYLTLRGIFQSDTILTLDEAATLPVVELHCGNSTIDVILSDYDDREVGGYYVNHTNYIVNYGYRNKFIGNSTAEFYYGHIKDIGYGVGVPVAMPNTDFMVIGGRNHYSQSPIISYLWNALAYADLRDSLYSLVFYDGTGYDFDDELDVSTALPAATAITSYNIGNLTSMRAATPSYLSNNAAKKDDEFAEIVFTKSTTWARFWITLSSVSTVVNRIQTIIHFSDATTVVSNFYPTKTVGGSFVRHEPFNITQLYLPNSTKIIIRLIGVADINVLVLISEIFACTENNTTAPILDVGGGQTIYGNLTLSGGVPKLLSQSVYADNAAAVAGGLVAGDTYRTATGQLMVVYEP